jgi:hypothetical protein
MLGPKAPGRKTTTHQGKVWWSEVRHRTTNGIVKSQVMR